MDVWRAKPWWSRYLLNTKPGETARLLPDFRRNNRYEVKVENDRTDPVRNVKDDLTASQESAINEINNINSAATIKRMNVVWSICTSVSLSGSLEDAVRATKMCITSLKATENNNTWLKYEVMTHFSCFRLIKSSQSCIIAVQLNPTKNKDVFRNLREKFVLCTMVFDYIFTRLVCRS